MDDDDAAAFERREAISREKGCWTLFSLAREGISVPGRLVSSAVS
jgi:hypothetical protein